MWFFSSHKTQRALARHSPPFRPQLEALEDRCLLSAGALDSTFGSGGIVTTPLGSGNSNAYSVAIQGDGKVLAAGNSTGGFTVARYTPTGALDTSFGKGGSVAVSFFSRTSTHLSGVALDSSGRIVLAGNTVSPSGQTYLALARLTSSGNLDPTFGKKGEILTSLGAELDAVVIQPDGKILAAGWGNTNGSGASFGVLARYNPNGSLDGSFGSGGLLTTYLAARATFSALALQSDGKILAAGREGFSATSNVFLFAVARFNPNGSLDGTFGSGGVVATSIAGNATGVWETGVHSLLVQGNGMIVAAGTVKNGAAWNSDAEVALARYDSSGNLDPAFGSSGVVQTPSSGNAYDAAVAAALQTDGKIVTAGFQNDSTGNYFQLERYTTAGTLDTAFNGTGMVMTAIGSGAYAYGLAIYPSSDTTGNAGKIVAVGNDGNFAVARYLPSEPQIGSLTANPNPVTAGGNVTLTASNIADGNANSTITQVAFYYYDGTGTKQFLGYGTQNSPGVWALNYTVNLASGTYTIYAQAKDSYGAFGDPLALTLTVP